MVERGAPWRRSLLVLVCMLLLFGPRSAEAHEFRPALLQVTEQGSEVGGAGHYRVRLVTPRVSTAGPMVPEDIVVVWPEHCVSEAARLDCGETGLVGTLRVEGLEQHPIDVLVELRFSDGTRVTSVLSPEQPSMSLGELSESKGPVVGVGREYFVLGVEHILGGIDHLLFVLGLVLLVRETKTLLWTITAFTLAHSITLACSTLELVALPGPPVEAGIALSILLLARELALERLDPEGPGSRHSWSFRYPWLVAFAFGLLHGFGFAGALAEVGLPPADVPLALLTFNLGVEAGQLGVVGVLLVVLAAWKWAGERLALSETLRTRLGALPVWAMGGVAFFWTLERVLGMF